MAVQADVRRIALSLPGTIESTGDFAFSLMVKGKAKGYAWVWKERVDPKKARVPQPKVLAIRTASLDDKEFLLKAHPGTIFTEPHYNGYPAVLVRLAEVRVPMLRELLVEAWRVFAPRGTSPTAPRTSSRSARRKPGGTGSGARRRQR
jgi:hypothetical protein